jgi:chromosome segregation protein
MISLCSAYVNEKKKMRLKSLELQGYKTFASKTIFEFAGAVTCIVGPNGSGKSNIADSLRWVLGEQSYSLLRGKKTEDMIFSGSEQRARASMASASVTFDNSDGWLPIDFSEVAITRRAFRDGTNEYLVNGQRVRLKNVSELLSQSGLAERTYTIIGQGVVDAALALKPEERRRLFEEAAGIGLHRTRREEAIRRLDTTKRNLERVQDILAELGPRLRSLERQARRAIEYDQVRADLRIMLREWYGYHWHQAQLELTQAREAAHKQEVLLEQAREAVSEAEAKSASKRSRIYLLRSQLNGWHRQLADLHIKREALNRAQVKNEERQNALQEQLVLLGAELAELTERVGYEQERLVSAQSELNRLEKEISEAVQHAQEARQNLAQRQEERATAEHALSSARHNLAEFTARQGSLIAQLAERRYQVERQAEAISSAEQAVESALIESQRSEERLSHAKIRFDKAEGACQNVRRLFEKARQRHDQILAEKSEVMMKKGALEAELARHQAQAEVLDQAERTLAGYTAGAQVILRLAVDQRLAGTHGTLAGLLEVPAELEIAISAALGEYLDAVVLENFTASEAALEALSNAPARAAMLPLDRIIETEPLSAEMVDKEEPGLIGAAANLVRAEPYLHPVVQLLLGRTVIVTDRVSAKRLLPRYTGEAGLRLVTLAGEIFHASGPLIAGHEGKTSALSQQRIRREIGKLGARLNEEIDQLQARLEQIEKDSQEALESTASLEKQDRELRKALEQALNAHSHEKAFGEKTLLQVKWQEELASRLRNELIAGQLEIVRIQSGRDSLQEDIEKSNQSVRECSAALRDLSTDDLQAVVLHWSTESAIAERAVRDAKQRQHERQEALESTRRSLTQSRQRSDDISAKLLELESNQRAHRAEESQLAESITLLQQQIEPAEAELVNIEQYFESLQESESVARHQLSKIENHHAQARILLAKRQDALDTWRRRIEDDFGLVNFEYVEAVSGPTPLPLDGLVETLPHIERIAPDLEERLRQQRAQLRRIGPVNPDAQAEYREVKARFEFMTNQVADLEQAEEDVRLVIAELDALMQKELRSTFDNVAVEFSTIFNRLFGGGAAKLVLTDPEDMTNTGIDIEARLPGRRSQGLSLLSGGERSLTAVSLVFALLKIAPTPFCLLDEVDAMLDEANIGRFRDLLSELSQTTQFIVVTHNRNTVQAADVIYGVTMGRDSVSQVISLKLDEIEKVVREE